MDPEQEKINAHWSEDSDNYDRIIHDELASFRAEAWMKRIREQTGGKTPLRVLDCGCGPGFFTILMARAGHRVTGIDGARGMLEKAGRNAAEQGVRAEILEMDCHELSFADDTFDLVISRNVTHALRDHRRVYAQWLRVLKPGGVLLIFDANWHLPQSSPALLRESLEREKRCIEVFGSDFSGNTVFDEERARLAYESERRHLLGDIRRPDWDVGLLQGLGFSEVTYERDITSELWDEKEKLIYGHTPMFMLRAVKPTAERM